MGGGRKTDGLWRWAFEKIKNRERERFYDMQRARPKGYCIPLFISPDMAQQ